jgi:nucleoside 2-deoxyribosyltransferase
MKVWCQKREIELLLLHPPSRILDVAYQARYNQADCEEQAKIIGRWQRDQVLKADACLLTADPSIDPGLGLLAGWASANGRPLLIYRADQRCSGEWGMNVDVATFSLADASHGGLVTNMEELHNMVARVRGRILDRQNQTPSLSLGEEEIEETHQ